MEAVIGLMLMILGVSHGVETYCDGRQNESQCYGALGGTVVLRLMDSTSEINRYEWSKKHTIILHGRKNKTVSNLIESRSSFTPSDGIFRINNLSRTDDGEYTLKIFDSKGSVQTTLQLTIKETVCDGRRDGAHCYGALGGTVILQLMDSTSEVHRYQWSRDATVILTGTRNKTVSNLIGNRSSFTPSDGTFRINNLNSTDDGDYTLRIFDSNGRTSERRTLQLTITDVETYCDCRLDGTQCYRDLGGTVFLRLMDNALTVFRYELSKTTRVILRGRKNKIAYNLIKSRSSFNHSDGTFRINNLSRTDAGEYTLGAFDLSGLRTEPRILQLIIQAPVSSVLLVSECLSQGEMRVSCSSEGANSPQYSWTLDGRTLTDAQLLSGNKESNNITLRQDISGRLVCSVSNLISRISTCGLRSTDCRSFSKMHLSQKMLVFSDTQCFEETSADSTVTEGRFLFFCGARTAVVILVLSGIFISWVWKKKYRKAEDSTIPRRTDHEDDSVVVLEMRSSASEL